MTGNEYLLLKVKQYFIGIENKQNFTKKKGKTTSTLSTVQNLDVFI